MSPPPNSLAVKRTILGLIALGFLGAWLVLELTAPGDGSTAGAIGICSRCGVIFGVLWLALPEVVNVRNRFWLVLALVAIVIVVWRPRLFPIVAVLLVVIALLRPRAPASKNSSCR